MIIRDFEPKHTEEAAEIALGAYNYERAFTQELPVISDIPYMKQLSGNGFGVAAFEGGKMIGFLCSAEPFENAFRSTDVIGVFSPMGANGAVMENHGKIYAEGVETSEQAMNVLEAISKRHSYRGKFKPDPIPRENLIKIMQAGLAEPSGCNKQTTSLMF